MQPAPFRIPSLVLCIPAVSSWAVTIVRAFAAVAFLAPQWRRAASRLRFTAALVAVFGFASGGLAQTLKAHFTGEQTTTYFGNGAPAGVAVDASGNLYLAAPLTNSVYKETPSANGYIQTVVADGSAKFGLSSPTSVAVDALGNVYVGDSFNNRVVKETPSGSGYTQSVVTASSGTGWALGVNAVAVDQLYNVYVADFANSQVLKETPTSSGYQQTVIANYASAGLDIPDCLAVDSNLNVYIGGEFFNTLEMVIKLAPTYGKNWTVVGESGSGLLPFSGLFYGLAVDAFGTVYIADQKNSAIVKAAPSNSGYTDTLIGSDPANPVNRPWGMAVDANNNLFIANAGAGQLIRIQPAAANLLGSTVGSQAATASLIFTFDYPGTLGSTAVVTQGAKGLDFTDSGAGTCTAGTAYDAGASCTVGVRFLPRFAGPRYGAAILYDTAGNAIATGYAQGTGNGPQINFLPGTQTVVGAGLANPTAIATDAIGNVFIADTSNSRVLMETPSAGGYSQTTIGSGFSYPNGIAVDGSGAVYVNSTGNGAIFKETPTAGGYAQTILAYGYLGAKGLAVDGSGNIYFPDSNNNRIVKETLNNGTYSKSTLNFNYGEGLNYPQAIAVDGGGNLYIADSYNNRVLKETLSGVNYYETPLLTGLNTPIGLALDPNSNLLIADYGNGRILKLLNTRGQYSQSVLLTGLSGPEGLALDGAGNLYIATYGNSQALKEDFADPPALTFASTPAGSASSDSPQTVTLANIGTADLGLLPPATGSNPGISPNFGVATGSGAECPLVTINTGPGDLPPNATCQLPVSFQPTVTGPITGSLTITDNSLYPQSAAAVQSLQLSGTGTIGTPAITWPAPMPITYGTPLGATQLNATTSVNGKFLYSPAPGTILPAGVYTLSVTFTPTDATTYNSVTATVSITVTPATLTVTANNSSVPYLKPLPAFTYTVSGFVNGDTSAKLTGAPIETTTATVGSVPGTYPIAITMGTIAASNYAFVFAGGTLTITPAGPTAAPVLSLATGTYTAPQAVTMTDAAPGAVIYYTTAYPTAPFSVPTPLSAKYTGPIQVSTSETIRAIAVAPNYAQSPMAFATYTINLTPAAVPVISLASGTYPGTQVVAIADATYGATIYYTINGAMPTVSSLVYAGPLTISTSETLVAVAIAPGHANSPPASAQYIIGASSTPFIYTLAGSQTQGYSGDGGLATGAQLNFPAATVLDKAGNIYIAESGNNRVRKVTAGTLVISTIAGTGIAGWSGDGGAATSAQLSSPEGLAFDSAGNLYIADTGNNRVREISSKTGVVTTYAGNGTGSYGGDGGPAIAAGLSAPSGLAFDATGNLYIADSRNNCIRKVSATGGTIATFAGNGKWDYTGDGGSASAAAFRQPEAISIDTQGNLYIADQMNNVIRKVAQGTWIISTIAGNGYGAQSYSGGYSGDNGPATSAELYWPQGVATDASGNVYIADSFNGAIRKVAVSTGLITTVAGNGNECGSLSGDGGPAASAPLCYPMGVSLDSALDIYIADPGYSRVREVKASSTSPTAPTATPAFSIVGGTYANPQLVAATDATPGAAIYLTLDGTTPTGASQGYDGPIGITGTVTLKAVAIAPGYLPSSVAVATYTILSPPAAVITTVAGNGVSGYNGTAGAATGAELGAPLGVALDSAQNLYIADPKNSVVWKVAAQTGLIAVAAGNGTPGYSGDGGQAANAQLNTPYGVAIDKSGNLYIADAWNNVIRKVAANTGVIATYAGNGTPGFSGDKGQATAAQLQSPWGVALDSAGNLYVADMYNRAIRKIAASTGIITTVAGNPAGVCCSDSGDGGLATAAALFNPSAVTLDSGDNLYISTQGGRIRKVAKATGIISTAAGNGDWGDSGDGGQGTAAEIGPRGIALDQAGNLYIVSGAGVRRVSASTGVIATVAGNGFSGYSGDGGSATVAELNSPFGLALDGAGSLYIGDQMNHRVRKVTFSNLAPPASTPKFSPGPGTYTSPQNVALTDTTASASIYYTMDGTSPTITSSKYATPLPVSTNQTIKAIAIAPNYSQSAVGSAAYIINLPTAATPTFAPPGGSYTTPQTVTLADTTSGAGIYYTTNGTAPTTASTKYAAPFTVNSTETIKAIAVASNYIQSGVGAATYTITLPPTAKPSFSPAGGVFNAAPIVTLTDATANAAIYYTTDGTNPTINSAKYNKGIPVQATETIKVIAIAPNHSASSVASATYTLTLPPTATPAFAPPGGGYASSQLVQITDLTSGAAIYYTIDGSIPTTSSSKYAKAIAVSTSETLSAIAIAPGHQTSSVATAKYTFAPVVKSISITPAAPTVVSGQAVQLKASATYSDGSSKDVTASVSWSSSTPITATVNASGLASGLSSGMTTVSASLSGISSAMPLLVLVPAFTHSTVVGYGNPTDARLSTLNIADGSTVDYYGSRNSNGAPISVSTVVLGRKNGTSTTATFDGAGRPLTVRSSGGVSIVIEWQSATEGNVTEVSADGTTRVGPLPFTLPQPKAPALRLEGGRLDREIRQLGGGGSMPSPNTNSTFGVVSVNVTHCGGRPVSNATLLMGVHTPGEADKTVESDVQPAEGVYLFHLAYPNQGPPPTVPVFCQGLADTIDSYCGALSTAQAAPIIVGVLGVAIAALAPPSAAVTFPLILGATEFAEIVGSGTVITSSVCQSISLGGSSFLSNACNNIGNLVNEATSSHVDLTLTPVAFSPSSASKAAVPQTVPASNPAASFAIDLGPNDDCGIVKVLVKPYPAIVSLSNQITLTAQGEDIADALVAGEYTWSSDNRSVATVDMNTGVLTGVSVGNANVTATEISSGIKGSAPVIVTKNIADRFLELIVGLDATENPATVSVSVNGVAIATNGPAGLYEICAVPDGTPMSVTVTTNAVLNNLPYLFADNLLPSVTPITSSTTSLSLQAMDCAVDSSCVTALELEATSGFDSILNSCVTIPGVNDSLAPSRASKHGPASIQPGTSRTAVRPLPLETRPQKLFR